MIVAIDFGTSNTVVARLNPTTQTGEILALPPLSQQILANPPLIPSLLYVEQGATGQVLLGQMVRDRGLDIPGDPRFFRRFKRGIGAEVQGFLPELEGKTITFEQAGSWFLTEILNMLQGDRPIESLVLTVPVDSFEAYRRWLLGLCNHLPVEQIRLIDEPTAAALGYGRETAAVVLVVDFGGGTVDFSLVQLNPLGQKNQSKPLGFILKWGDQVFGEGDNQRVKTARVLAKAGQNLGGSDIDDWLVDYFIATQNIPKSTLITRLAERLKIQLSSQVQADETYFDDQTLDSYHLELDRPQFHAILAERGFFNSLDGLMAQVLQQGRSQGIDLEAIDTVLLVGGTTQLPAVQDWIRQYFPSSKIRVDNPFGAIALGGLQLAQGFELKDFLYHSYGIRYWNRRDRCHSWHPLIPAGQPYPMTEPIELFLGASVDNQPSIELILGELGTQTSTTSVYFDGDRLVTRVIAGDNAAVQPLNDREGARTIAQLSPPGIPGGDRLRLEFRVDSQRQLRLTVEDLLTQQEILTNAIVAELS